MRAALLLKLFCPKHDKYIHNFSRMPLFIYNIFHIKYLYFTIPEPKKCKMMKIFLEILWSQKVINCNKYLNKLKFLLVRISILHFIAFKV